MRHDRRNFLLSSAAAAALVTIALLLTGTLPFLPQGLLSTLSKVTGAASAAAPYWYNSLGSSYAPYPGQTSCIAGTGSECAYNCDGNPVYGAISVQKSDSSAGGSGWVYQSGSAGSSGTSASVSSISETLLLDYSCTPGRNRSNQHTECHTVACGKGWCTSCGCYGDAGSYETFNSSATVRDAEGAVLATNSGNLYGTINVQPGGAAGTYDVGDTVQYALYCSGTATPAVASVTIGPSTAQITISATPNPVRSGIDQTVLKVNFSEAAANTCELIGPDSELIKSYTETSITDDLVTVGPITATSTYRVKCTGTEGFNKYASVEVGVKTPPNLSITANNTPTQVMILPGTSADIRWTSSNQAPNSCSVTYTASGGSCFTAANTIATQGAYHWRTFTIGSDIYLAGANAYDGSNYSLNSKLYKWMSGSSCFGDGTTCGAAHQDIPTKGAAALEPFTFGSDTYLAVANSRDDTTRSVDSKIYKWMSGSSCFGNGTTCGSAYQAIATNGAVHLKPVYVGANAQFLAVANYRDDAGYSVNSEVYRWTSSGGGCPAGGGFGNGTDCTGPMQTIPTKGAYRMESFTLEGLAYLAVSNAYDGSGHNLPSQIYKYTAEGIDCPAAGAFGNGRNICGVPFQTINTSGAYGWKFFTIGAASYLAVANSFDGSSFNINSKIYQWMPVSKCFGDGTTCGAAYQAIATNGATQLQTFSVGPQAYLIAANAYNGSSYNINSNIYQWMPGPKCFGNGAACGAVLQAVPTNGVSWWEPVQAGAKLYLIGANYYNGSTRALNSPVSEWSPSGCGTTELGPPTLWTGDQSPVPNGYATGVFSGIRDYILSCKWLDNTTASSTNVRVVLMPELILSANGSTTDTVYITPGTSATINWSTKNVVQNSCSVTNTADSSVWNADNNTSGYPTPVLDDQEQVTYTLSCTNLVGTPHSNTLTVVGAIPVPLAGDLTISASRVVRGARPTIKWSAQNLVNGISCSIAPTLQGGSSVSNWDGTGSSWSSPVGGALGPVITSTTVFTLTCVNKAGDSVGVSASAYLIPSFLER